MHSGSVAARISAIQAKASSPVENDKSSPSTSQYSRESPARTVVSPGYVVTTKGSYNKLEDDARKVPLPESPVKHNARAFGRSSSGDRSVSFARSPSLHEHSEILTRVITPQEEKEKEGDNKDVDNLSSTVTASDIEPMGRSADGTDSPGYETPNMHMKTNEGYFPAAGGIVGPSSSAKANIGIKRPQNTPTPFNTSRAPKGRDFTVPYPLPMVFDIAGRSISTTPTSSTTGSPQKSVLHPMVSSPSPSPSRIPRSANSNLNLNFNNTLESLFGPKDQAQGHQAQDHSPSRSPNRSPGASSAYSRILPFMMNPTDAFVPRRASPSSEDGPELSPARLKHIHAQMERGREKERADKTTSDNRKEDRSRDGRESREERRSLRRRTMGPSREHFDVDESLGEQGKENAEAEQNVEQHQDPFLTPTSTTKFSTTDNSYHVEPALVANSTSTVTTPANAAHVEAEAMRRAEETAHDIHNPDYKPSIMPHRVPDQHHIRERDSRRRRQCSSSDPVKPLKAFAGAPLRLLETPPPLGMQMPLPSQLPVLAIHDKNGVAGRGSGLQAYSRMESTHVSEPSADSALSSQSTAAASETWRRDITPHPVFIENTDDEGRAGSLALSSTLVPTEGSGEVWNANTEVFEKSGLFMPALTEEEKVKVEHEDEDDSSPMSNANEDQKGKKKREDAASSTDDGPVKPHHANLNGTSDTCTNKYARNTTQLPSPLRSARTTNSTGIHVTVSSEDGDVRGGGERIPLSRQVDGAGDVPNPCDSRDFRLSQNQALSHEEHDDHDCSPGIHLGGSPSPTRGPSRSPSRKHTLFHPYSRSVDVSVASVGENLDLSVSKALPSSRIPRLGVGDSSRHTGSGRASASSGSAHRKSHSASPALGISAAAASRRAINRSSGTQTPVWAGRVASPRGRSNVSVGVGLDGAGDVEGGDDRLVGETAREEEQEDSTERERGLKVVVTMDQDVEDVVRIEVHPSPKAKRESRERSSLGGKEC